MKRFTRRLPKDLTSYDLLKSFAVITMVIDHVGTYFFPDQMGWRIVGRMSFPVWLFLIGYAETRDISRKLWIGGFILLLGNIIVGMSVFSLNILFTIIAVRLLLDGVMRFALANLQSLLLTVFAMVVLALPTSFIAEYGTQAVLFAMFGYMVRHQRKLSLSNEMVLIFMFGTVFVYAIVQKIVFGMDNTEFLTMGAGVFFTGLVLCLFRPKLFPSGQLKLPDMMTGVFKFMGRRTQEIYVGHLLIFKIAGLIFFAERFALFQWSLF